MTPNPLHQDYLFMGALIARQLTEQLPDMPVEGVAELAQIVDSQDQRTHCAFVLWAGDRFVDTALGGAANVVNQQWDVWLRLRNDARFQQSPADEAGPYLSKLHRALAGWRPEGLHRPMRRTSGPRPNYTKLSGMYPLTFEITLNL